MAVIFENLGINISFSNPNREIVSINFYFLPGNFSDYQTENQFEGVVMFNGKKLFKDKHIDYFPFDGEFKFEKLVGKQWFCENDQVYISARFSKINKYLALGCLHFEYKDKKEIK